MTRGWPDKVREYKGAFERVGAAAVARQGVAVLDGQAAIFLLMPRCFSIAETRTSSWSRLSISLLELGQLAVEVLDVVFGCHLSAKIGDVVGDCGEKPRSTVERTLSSVALGFLVGFLFAAICGEYSIWVGWGTNAPTV
jgi:hypothetical protein